MTSQSIISLFEKSESYFMPEYLVEYKDQIQRQITMTIFRFFRDLLSMNRQIKVITPSLF